MKAGDPVIHKGQKCQVVFQVINVVTIKLPSGDTTEVCERKLKRPEDF